MQEIELYLNSYSSIIVHAFTEEELYKMQITLDEFLNLVKRDKDLGLNYKDFILAED